MYIQQERTGGHDGSRSGAAEVFATDSGLSTPIMGRIQALVHRN